uniref:Translation initiation factor eIF2B subunit alpha n=1 Tax=Parascaris univalens TaxID=6257 RepID=A0A914ZVB0_PARUN
MELKGVARHFSDFYNTDSDHSIGLAAIKTLMKCIEDSKAKTVNELTDELKNVEKEMFTTDYSFTTIRSASELFLRFISLATAEQNVQEFSQLMDMYCKRGRIFIERVARSRSLISRFARPFVQNNSRILTHSFSRVVLRALIDAKGAGVDVHIFVTESHPDVSGKTMFNLLRDAGIRTTLILDSAVGYLMESIDMVLIGAEGVMETGGVINKIGTLSMAICAKAMNKPVYVMAESIKFVKEYPLNQSDIPFEFKYRSSVLQKSEGQSPEVDLSEEHPTVDYTPPQYINLLFTDLGILTPAAVGDELIKLYT